MRRIGLQVVRMVGGVALVGMCMASSCWDQATGTDTSTTDPGGATIASDQLEVTTDDGQHFGPSAITAGTASLVDVNDQFGSLSKSTISLQLTTSTAQFAVTLQRYGTNIAPFAADTYQIAEASGETPDRTVSLSGLVNVVVNGTSLQCGTGSCSGMFVIDAITSSYLEGYLSASVQSTSGGTGSVVVSFNVPWTTYSP